MLLLSIMPGRAHRDRGRNEAAWRSTNDDVGARGRAPTLADFTSSSDVEDQLRGVARPTVPASQASRQLVVKQKADPVLGWISLMNMVFHSFIEARQIDRIRLVAEFWDEKEQQQAAMAEEAIEEAPRVPIFTGPESWLTVQPPNEYTPAD